MRHSFSKDHKSPNGINIGPEGTIEDYAVNQSKEFAHPKGQPDYQQILDSVRSRDSFKSVFNHQNANSSKLSNRSGWMPQVLDQEGSVIS